MSVQLRLAEISARVTFKQALKHMKNFQSFRKFFNTQARLLFIRPRSVRYQAQTLSGSDFIQASTPKSDAKKIVFYIHGGGFCFASPHTHKHLGGDIAKQCGATCMLPFYPLAPEHPFPAGIEGVIAAYEALIKDGCRASDISLVGDSAGGCFVFLLLAHLIRKKADMPACAVAISPVVDLRFLADSFETNKASDAVLPSDRLRKEIVQYLPEGGSERLEVSPIFANFKGAPPILIQYCEDEILRDDALAMAKKLEGENVDVTLSTWKGGFHVFHLMRGPVPEANRAIREISQFIERNM